MLHVVHLCRYLLYISHFSPEGAGGCDYWSLRCIKVVICYTVFAHNHNK